MSRCIYATAMSIVLIVCGSCSRRPSASTQEPDATQPSKALAPGDTEPVKAAPKALSPEESVDRFWGTLERAVAGEESPDDYEFCATLIRTQPGVRSSMADRYDDSPRPIKLAILSFIRSTSTEEVFVEFGPVVDKAMDCGDSVLEVVAMKCSRRYEVPDHRRRLLAKIERSGHKDDHWLYCAVGVLLERYGPQGIEPFIEESFSGDFGVTYPTQIAEDVLVFCEGTLRSRALDAVDKAFRDGLDRIDPGCAGGLFQELVTAGKSGDARLLAHARRLRESEHEYLKEWASKYVQRFGSE